MRFEFKLPDLAEGMVEGEITQWLVAVGDAVKEEQPVVEIMTDKATVVISSPKAGRVLSLEHASGDLAPVGSLLFVLEIDAADAEAAAAVPDPEPASAASAAAAAVEDARVVDEDSSGRAVALTPAERTLAPVRRGPGRSLATPATRRLAREVGVDLEVVAGSGPGGRVTKEDVHAAARAVLNAERSPAPRREPTPEAQSPRSTAASSPGAPTARESQGPGEEREERVRIRGLRRAIYETMRRSKAHAAHFTYVEEVECTQLVAWRERLKPAAEARGVQLSYLPFIAKATLLALARFPKMNASVDEDAGEIVLKRFFHLGFAAATEAGLTVPTIRFADRMTLLELAARIAELAAKARRNQLAPGEVGGSTFTITSLGKLGGLLATPIINHPEVGILGVHKLEPRAVVRDGQIVARSMMNLSLSFDHRVVDGHEGAEFAQVVRRYLEEPELMILEMA